MERACALSEKAVWKPCGTVSRNTRQARGQCGQNLSVEGGKFCRNGINCRARRGIGAAENPRFIGFLAMARRLLIP
jgi:hypothetical protein